MIATEIVDPSISFVSTLALQTHHKLVKNWGNRMRRNRILVVSLVMNLIRSNVSELVLWVPLCSFPEHNPNKQLGNSNFEISDFRILKLPFCSFPLVSLAFCFRARMVNQISTSHRDISFLNSPILSLTTLSKWLSNKKATSRAS